jgi:GTPase SAR1 family protein
MALSSLVQVVAQLNSATQTPNAQPAQPVVQTQPQVVVQPSQPATTPKPRKPKPVEPTPTPTPIVQPATPKLPNAFANHPFVNAFNRPLRKAELFFGNPSTGKTTFAKRLAQHLVDTGAIKDYVVVHAHEEMTVMSMFKTTTTDENGTWKFLQNKFFKMLTDELQERYVIIIDEINTLAMSVLKAFQPVADDTEGSFYFENKTYRKNPNVFFIATMNHKDVGTSPLPKAIKSRFFPVFFKDLDATELSKRTNVPETFLQLLKRVYDMFSPLGDVHEFFNDVRQLKNMAGLSREQFKDLITSHLELANIDWQAAVSVSPEFNNILDEYSNIKW